MVAAVQAFAGNLKKGGDEEEEEEEEGEASPAISSSSKWHVARRAILEL